MTRLGLELQNVLFLYATEGQRSNLWVFLLVEEVNGFSPLETIFTFLFSYLSSATMKSGKNLSMICKRKSRNLRSGSHTLYDPSTRMLRRLLLSMPFQKPKHYWSWIGQWSFYRQVNKYRQTQRDWFGKKGKPWHITVAITKANNEEIEVRFML